VGDVKSTYLWHVIEQVMLNGQGNVMIKTKQAYNKVSNQYLFLSIEYQIYNKVSNQYFFLSLEYQIYLLFS